MKRSLNVLDDIRIASPCHASWANMAGDERVRHCGECKNSVYNLSTLTTVEANQLLEATEAKICVRLYKRADGTVITSDCRVQRDRMLRRVAKRVVQIAASWLGISILSGCRDGSPIKCYQGKPAPLVTSPTMGEPIPITKTTEPSKR